MATNQWMTIERGGKVLKFMYDNGKWWQQPADGEACNHPDAEWRSKDQPKWQAVRSVEIPNAPFDCRVPCKQPFMRGDKVRVVHNNRKGDVPANLNKEFTVKYVYVDDTLTFEELYYSMDACCMEIVVAAQPDPEKAVPTTPHTTKLTQPVHVTIQRDGTINKYMYDSHKWWQLWQPQPGSVRPANCYFAFKTDPHNWARCGTAEPVEQWNVDNVLYRIPCGQPYRVRDYVMLVAPSNPEVNGITGTITSLPDATEPTLTIDCGQHHGLFSALPEYVRPAVRRELPAIDVAERYEDESVDGKIRVTVSADGDATLCISRITDAPGKHRGFMGVTFKMSGPSPHVAAAIQALEVAIRKDNEITGNKGGQQPSTERS